MGDQTGRSTLTPRCSSALRIVVCGYVVRGPIGGMAWHHLQYVLGLKGLGHEVLFLEDSEDFPACYNPTTHQVTEDPTYGLEFACRGFDQLGMADAWAYYDAHRSLWHGPAAGRAVDFCRSADLLLNVSGVNPPRAWTLKVPVRALIDTDPVFTQVRHLTDAVARERAGLHTHFLSFGEQCATTGHAIPRDGFPWQPTRQPVWMDVWEPTSPPQAGSYTTVMQWESYSPVQYGGCHYGMKGESFQQIMDLPRQVAVALEVAVGGRAAPREELRAAGWRLKDPLKTTASLWTYQQYLQRSRGEMSVAKHGYVVGKTGWFSERSANYLASGRPVITQDTGFRSILPTGAGLHAFSNVDEAAAALERVETNYRQQCRQARELAAEYFDSRRVLMQLLEDVANEPARSSRN